MSILVDRNTRVVVQGITGSAGSFHSEQMLAYGTKVVAGVTPGRGGTRFQGQVPIFNTVEQAVRETGANASAVFVPPRSPPTRSSRPPTPASRWWSPSPRESRSSTWCG